MPEWALRERRQDLMWVGDNLHVFRSVAESAYAEVGRGAIVVDTAVSTRSADRESGGNPFSYFAQVVFESGDDEDIKRMVRAYNPARELVIVLIKPDQRVSMYRVIARRPG